MKYFALYRRRKECKAHYPAGTVNELTTCAGRYTDKYKYHHWPRPIRKRYSDLLWQRFKTGSPMHTVKLMRYVYGTPHNTVSR